MKKQTRSILQELNSMITERDRKYVIESRGENIINSAINLINEMRVHYNDQTAGELERRLINSIRAQDPSKFVRGVKRIDEGK
jgi:hypothetical protein